MIVVLYKLEPKLENIIYKLYGDGESVDFVSVADFEEWKKLDREQSSLIAILQWGETTRNDFKTCTGELENSVIVGLTPHRDKSIAKAMFDSGFRAAMSVHQLNSLPLILHSIETQVPVPLMVLDEMDAEILLKSVNGGEDELA